MEGFNRAQYQIPPAEIIRLWTKEVLRYKPDDITTFSRDYFTHLEEGTLQEFLETLPQNGLRVPEQTTDPIYILPRRSQWNESKLQRSTTRATKAQTFDQSAPERAGSQAGSQVGSQAGS
jgi:hypothetical protein